MNKTCFWRIRGLAAMTAMGLLLAGCGPQSKGPGDTAQEPAVRTATESAPPAAAASDSNSTKHRELDAANVGPTYCIVRNGRDSQNKPKLTKVPIVALARKEDWITLKDIRLSSLPHTGSCPIGATLEGNKLTISGGDGGAFKVTLVDADGRTTMTQVFRYAGADETVHTGSYLVADKRCDEGSANCGGFDHFDAYLYAVDTRQSASDRKLPKFVVLDLFDDVDASEECRLERPGSAVNTRDPNSGDCTLEALQPDMTAAGGTSTTASGASQTVVMRALQTGTGGGYEPPP